MRELGTRRFTNGRNRSRSRTRPDLDVSPALGAVVGAAGDGRDAAAKLEQGEDAESKRRHSHRLGELMACDQSELVASSTSIQRYK